MGAANEIIWGNRAVKSGADIFIISKGNTSVSPSFSTIGKVANSKLNPGLYIDDGTNIAGTPVLVNPYLGDCHLNSDSPAIDAGTASGAPSSDFEGDARPQGAGYDMGADEYTVSFYPDVTLLSFIGGEGIPSGRRCDITWGAPPEALKFTLKYSLNNGKRWKNIARDVTGRHFSWKVPRLLKNKPKCLVKVSGYNASGGVAGTDRSGTPFTIEVLRLNSPNGGEVLASGNSCIIRWVTNGTKEPVRKVKLFYSTRRPPVWKKIATLGRTAKSHEWSIPSVVTARSKCKVKVVLKDKFGKTVGADTSDTFFTIRP